MSKKKPIKNKENHPAKEKEVKIENTENKELSTKGLLGLTFLLAVVYFIFSTFSDGFYMHDEVGNFINAQNL